MKEIGIFENKKVVDVPKYIPKKLRVGDVIYVAEINHPMLILRLQNSVAICVGLTSNRMCEEIIGTLRTRFEFENYITTTQCAIHIDKRQKQYRFSVEKAEVMRVKNLLAETLDFSFRRNIKYKTT